MNTNVKNTLTVVKHVCTFIGFSLAAIALGVLIDGLFTAVGGYVLGKAANIIFLIAVMFGGPFDALMTKIFGAIWNSKEKHKS